MSECALVLVLSSRVSRACVLAQIWVSDNGFTGLGGPSTAALTINTTVLPVNDPPTALSSRFAGVEGRSRESAA